MEALDIFRWILLLLGVAFLGPRFYYRWQARQFPELPEEPHLLQRVSPWRLAIMGLTGLGANVIAVLWWIKPEWVDFARWLLPAWSRWAGVVIGVGAVTLSYLGHRTLRVNFTSVLQTRLGHELVMEGIYRLIRHPIYASFFGLFAASFLITENWLIALLGMVYSLAILNRVLVEEVMLRHAFGDRYREYMQHTGRFFPKISR